MLFRSPVDGLVNPGDLTSCSKFRCLYISDWDGGVIHRVELGGATTRWKVNDRPFGLSVTPDPDFHLLVTCVDARELKEFTTNGTLVRKIRLQEDLVHPLHAIQFDGQFIVSHGWLYSDPLHRVCIVNSTGHATRCYGGSRWSAAGQLDAPRHLAVDEEGNVLVADCNNKRVLLLNKTLDYVRELVSTQNSGRSRLEPWRLCLDVSRGRLFVADGGQNDVLVFKVRDGAGRRPWYLQEAAAPGVSVCENKEKHSHKYTHTHTETRSNTALTQPSIHAHIHT